MGITKNWVSDLHENYRELELYISEHIEDMKKRSSIYVKCASPNVAESLFGEYEDTNSYDFFFSGYINNSHIYCTANSYYGHLEFYIDSEELDEESADDDVNEFGGKYCTSVKVRGQKVENVPPIVDNVSEVTLNKLVESKTLTKFYAWRSASEYEGYTLIYAKTNLDAIHRLFGLWGDYSSLLTEEEFNKKRDWYVAHCSESLSRTKPKHELDGNESVFILDWNYMKED